MKLSMFAIAFLTILPAVIRADAGHILRASFPDGTGVEIRTETTGSSQIDSEGEMGIGPGIGSQDLVNRVVLDRGNNILFAYNLEALRGTRPGTVTIRIAPISPATEAAFLKNSGAPGRPRFAGAHLPTVAGIRDFPDVKIGQAVTLDILYNPSTGEKIFDVLRPIPAPVSGMSVTVVPSPETISLKDVSVRVNGRAVAAPASFIVGSAVRVDIPGHGTYVVAAYDPHQAGFSATAHADGNTLVWALGGDRVEITSMANILTGADQGVLWILHDPNYRPDVAGLQSADTVDWLLPKK
jgi:hypothetical protein